MYSKETFVNLGKLLKDARIAQNLSQRDVSQELGYSSPQFISNIERGLCMPPLKQLKVMIDMYKLNPSEVYELIVDAQSAYIRDQLGLGSSRKKNRKSS